MTQTAILLCTLDAMAGLWVGYYLAAFCDEVNRLMDEYLNGVTDVVFAAFTLPALEVWR